MTIYNRQLINGELIPMINAMPPGMGKQQVIDELVSKFNLIKDRKVYYCSEFALRVSTSKDNSFSNTVLALSSLLKYDSEPFIVIVVHPHKVVAYLANTTLLEKISHSSHELRIDNIRGSFNGSDIIKKLDGLANIPSNFERLFGIHQAFTSEENIERLVESTNGITPNKIKPIFSVSEVENILQAPNRAIAFNSSGFYRELLEDLENRTSRVADAIKIAALIENVNLRGRVVEELVTSDDPDVVEAIRKDLRDGRLLTLKTDQKLGDYCRIFRGFHTETDIKTKVMFLHSSPKAFNIDKFLTFLSDPQSVYMLFVIGIDDSGKIVTRFLSVFEKQLLHSLRIQFHWAGRNSRGVTQLDGAKLDKILTTDAENVSVDEATRFLQMLVEL